MRSSRGSTLLDLLVALAILSAGIGAVAPLAHRAIAGVRLHGATVELYGAVHATRARARVSSRFCALVIEDGGRAFRIVEDSGGANLTVAGPWRIAEGVVAQSNVTIRFSPKGFAVPFGTITLQSEEGGVRYLVVNILGRVRVAPG